MADINNLVVELVRVKNEHDELEERTKQKKRKYDELNRLVTNSYKKSHIKSLTVEVDGRKKIVHLHGQYWAKKKDEGVSGEQVYEALIESGVPELAQKTYNTQSLSAWMREQVEQNPDYELPEPLANLVDFKKVTQVRVTGK